MSKKITKVEEVKEKQVFIDTFKKVKDDKPPTFKEYHFRDRGEPTDNTDSSYAMKREYTSGRKEYFVKTSTTGGNVGKMLNPWGPFYKEGDAEKYERQMGRMKYEFRPVTEEKFELYLKFLNTRNELYIINVERV